jgi:hypothetical protein
MSDPMSGMLSSIQQVLSQESSNFMSCLLHFKLDKQSLGPNPPHNPIMGQNPPFLFHRSSCLAGRSQVLAFVWNQKPRQPILARRSEDLVESVWERPGMLSQVFRPIFCSPFESRHNCTCPDQKAKTLLGGLRCSISRVNEHVFQRLVRYWANHFTLCGWS